jgi:hypothetical protein
MVVPLLRFVILLREYDFYGLDLRRKSENKDPGAVHPFTGSFLAVPFRSSGLCPGPGVLYPAWSLPRTLIHLSPLTILSPICPSCCSRPLLFFLLAFLVSHPPSHSCHLSNLPFSSIPLHPARQALLVRSKDW